MMFHPTLEFCNFLLQNVTKWVRKNDSCSKLEHVVCLCYLSHAQGVAKSRKQAEWRKGTCVMVPHVSHLVLLLTAFCLHVLRLLLGRRRYSFGILLPWIPDCKAYHAYSLWLGEPSIFTGLCLSSLMKWVQEQLVHKSQPLEKMFCHSAWWRIYDFILSYGTVKVIQKLYFWYSS